MIGRTMPAAVRAACTHEMNAARTATDTATLNQMNSR